MAEQEQTPTEADAVASDTVSGSVPKPEEGDSATPANAEDTSADTAAGGSEDKVLVEKEGKFELLTAEELKAREVKEATGLMETPRTTSDVTASPADATATRNGAEAKTDVNTPCEPSTPPPSSPTRKPRAQSARGSRKPLSKPSGRERPKSARPASKAESPHRGNNVPHSPGFKQGPGHSMTMFKSEGGRDAWEAWFESKRKQKSPKKSGPSRDEIEARRLAAERESAQAYEAWKTTKEKELAKLKKQRAEEKANTMPATKTKHDDAETEAAFQGWMERKKEEDRNLLRQKTIRVDYTAQIQAQQAQRMRSDEAVKEWMKRKAKQDNVRRKEVEQRKKQMVREAREINKRMQERLRLSTRS